MDTSSVKGGSQENPASAMATPAPALGGTAPVLADVERESVASPRPWQFTAPGPDVRDPYVRVVDAEGELVLSVAIYPRLGADYSSRTIADLKMIVAAVNLVYASDAEGDPETRWALAEGKLELSADDFRNGSIGSQTSGEDGEFHRRIGA